MSVYVDELRSYGTGNLWCHLWADDNSELVRFANFIGLEPKIQQINNDVLYYDLTPGMRRKAIKNGANVSASYPSS